jgi:hypothetical protein
MKYTSPGFRSVEASSMNAAAVIFAERAARKQYGKSGYCGTCMQVARSTDGRSAEYSAFISYTLRGKHNETVGHNHPFVVYAAYETRGGQRSANQKRPSNLVSDHSSTINTHWSLGASREPVFRESIKNRLRVSSENLLLNHQNP